MYSSSLFLLKLIVIFVIATPTEGRWQFCRLEHAGEWNNDYPTAEEKLVAMLKDVIRIDAAPETLVISTTEQGLSQCAFVYTSNIELLFWPTDEAKIIGDWLRKGGFLWTDGFWSDESWSLWNLQLQKVLPDTEVKELDSHHPIFNYPFQIQLQQYNAPGGGWVKNFAVEDDKGRLMVLMTFNEKKCSDCGAVGDGWQNFLKNWQSQEASWMFSINVFLYIMTH